MFSRVRQRYIAGESGPFAYWGTYGRIRTQKQDGEKDTRQK